MNCGQVQHNLAEDLASRADPELARHLNSCAACRRMCDDLLELEELSQSLSGSFRVPDSFQAEVLARAALERPRNRRLRLALAAGFCFAAFLGLVRPWEGLNAVDLPDAGPYPERWSASIEDGGSEGQVPLVEVLIEGFDKQPVILRLPSTIEIRRTDLQEDFYIRHVSH